jgi:hypothetical protein
MGGRPTGHFGALSLGSPTFTFCLVGFTLAATSVVTFLGRPRLGLNG